MMEEVMCDKNGFPLNSSRQHYFPRDENGNFFLPFVDGTVTFSLAGKEEEEKAVDEISERLAAGFNSGLEKGWFLGSLGSEKEKAWFLGCSESGRTKLLERGYQVGKPMEIHGIEIYFDQINVFLDYLGNAGGWPFKESIYLKFKNKIKNYFLTVKAGLYPKGVPRERLEFVDMWLKSTDEIIQQERRQFADFASEPRSKDSANIGNSSPKHRVTHRVQAIAHYYKVKAGIEEPLTAKQMKDISSKRYEAYLALYSPKTETRKYKPETAEELKEAFEVVAGWPEAQEEIRKSLSKIDKAT